MLDKKGFDEWASEYDAAVESSMKSGTYPFCGYKAVHDAAYDIVSARKSVVDLGVGTARFSERLYQTGVKVTAVDFSENMLDAAKRKMPSADMLCADLTKGLPPRLRSGEYDAFTALYSIHHLTDAQKVDLISAALDAHPGAIFVIGDVAFEDEKQRLACKDASPDFDDAEYYCVYDRLKDLLPYKTTFTKISFCAAVITVSA